jgi:hypothetical protein
VPGVEKYQFIKTAGEATGTAKLKIDILIGPRDGLCRN